MVLGKLLGGLFGGGGDSGDATEAARDTAVDYNGFAIEASPFKTGGQWQTCGVISKEIEGERKEHKFIRADTHGSRDDAAAHAINKAKRIIDEQGERMFNA